MRLLSNLKNLALRPGSGPRKILAGPFKGIRMNLSLRDQTQVYLGLFEKETHPWLERLSKSIGTAIDVGAAHGEHTLFFLLKTRAKKVYAFEPDSSCFPLLAENLKLNAVTRSERLQICAKFVGGSESDHEIRLDSLRDAIDMPCLIKVDVDGAEEYVLQGASLLNRLSGVRWLIETHSRELEVACLGILLDAGFQTRVIRNAWWRFAVPELRAIPHNRWLAAWKTN
jgi:hypothetical protein